MEQVDILVSGGGIAGLAAAAGLARAGYSVCLVDPKTAANDLRSTAYLLPGRTFLEKLGLWDGLDARATPLEALRVIDTAGDPPGITADRTFQATDLDTPAFGWNLPNGLVREALLSAMNASENVELSLGEFVTGLTLREKAAVVTLSNGRRLEAKLVVGADGRDSTVRGLAGIGQSTLRYGQKAIAAVLTHDVSHRFVSTEVYAKGGAFTLVPLPDTESSHRSALVWMEDGADARALAEMPAAVFGAAATERCVSVLGPLSLASERQIWPIVTRTAHRLTVQRVALIAEAAHVLPPIGAQGLNTSLADIRALIEAVGADGPGSAAMLARYERARYREIRLRARAIDAYNRLCRSGNPAFRSLRAAGLKAAYDIKPLRDRLMRVGMGV